MYSSQRWLVIQACRSMTLTGLKRTFVYAENLTTGILIKPKSEIGLGVVKYAWWSEGNIYSTRIKFRIKSTEPSEIDQICDIELYAESIGHTIRTKNIKITKIEEANIKNNGICQVELAPPLTSYWRSESKTVEIKIK